ncbi:MAG: hypothetical protein MHM6MM_005714 [Cercozoa sp. M6MM]
MTSTLRRMMLLAVSAVVALSSSAFSSSNETQEFSFTLQGPQAPGVAGIPLNIEVARTECEALQQICGSPTSTEDLKLAARTNKCAVAVITQTWLQTDTSSRGDVTNNAGKSAAVFAIALTHTYDQVPHMLEALNRKLPASSSPAEQLCAQLRPVLVQVMALFPNSPDRPVTPSSCRVCTPSPTAMTPPTATTSPLGTPQ